MAASQSDLAEAEVDAAETVTADLPARRPDDTTFEDVLAEYQALNLRLARVAAPLRLANRSLCPELVRDPGFSVHQLKDYPNAVQPIAEVMLGLRPNGIFVRSVRPGTSAEEQRVSPGDEIVAVNGNAISPKPIMDTYNEAVLRNGFESVLSKVRIKTPEGQDYVARIRPDTACDIPAKVVFSDVVNGHTDGDDVLITSALMTAVPDDTNLALVIAHEMGHVIAEHMNLPPAQDLELEADRMALVLLARSGYDIDAAVSYWQRAAHPHEGGPQWESSHPTTQARYKNFRDELDRIKKVQETTSSYEGLKFRKVYSPE